MTTGFNDVLTEKKRLNEEAKQLHVSPRLPWANQVMNNMNDRKRDSSPSPLLGWYHTENAKRQKGLENEIDIADIKAALKGVRNKWFGVVQKFEKEIDEMICGIKKNGIDWQKIMEYRTEFLNEEKGIA